MTQTVLKVEQMVKVLSGYEILHKVSFQVQEWEIYWFLGPNGAWKTTTMKCILGLITQESGTIEVLGISGLSIESKKRIGFMPENTYLYKYLTGKEFLKFNAKFFGISGLEAEKKINTLLEKVGLDRAGNQYLNSYSKGMLQRIGLAQSIINEPKLLFLDEPMSGLDPIGRKMVKDLLIELKAKGTTIFFNTHILADVESICDKFSIINRGNLIVESKPIGSLNTSLEDFFIEEVEADNLKYASPAKSPTPPMDDRDTTNNSTSESDVKDSKDADPSSDGGSDGSSSD